MAPASDACDTDRVKLSRSIGVVALLVAGGALFSACSPAAPAVIAPVVEDVGDLQGATIELRVGQVLDINTGSMAVDSYSGTVADPEIAEFVAGHTDATATFNPGVTGLAEGTTTVVLSNSNGGIQDVTFTVDVSSP